MKDRIGLRLVILAGTFAALSAAMRPTDALFFAVSVGVIIELSLTRTMLRAYLGAALLIGGIVVTYNNAIFEDPRGGYTTMMEFPLGQGLLGVLFSPGRGLLIYTPVLAFVLLGLWRWRNQGELPERMIYWICLLFSAGLTLTIAKWPLWWGGDCYGPRLLADILPCLIILMVPAMDAILGNRALRFAFAATALISIGIQFIGAFSYPKGFTPELWSWERCPIITNARAGTITGPYQEVIRWGRELMQGKVPDLGNSADYVH